VKLSQIDLNLLLTLDAIIKERSVTRAGRSVGLSQLAMSAALGRLRQLLGDPLLERVGREYRLKPLAVQIAEPLQGILVSIERTPDRDQSGFDPAVAQRNFRLAGSDYTVCTVFRSLVAHIEQVAPGVQLRFQRAGGRTARHLSGRDIDLSIQPVESHRDFASQPLFRDRFLCALWTGNTVVGEHMTEEQFCTLGHVAYSHPPFGYSSLEHFAGRAIARKLQIRAMADSFISLPFLLQGTDLIALVQERLGLMLQRAAAIRLVESPVPLAALTFAMWSNPLYDVDEAHQWLRATLVEVTRSAPGATLG
jgi:LysR family nod box-dependent transcriptional activator